MKKIIALLLAIIMTFSVATVAFATDAETTTPDTETTAPSEGGEGETDVMGTIEDALGEYDWILDLPFGTVKPALKIAKIALKLLKVYLKICDAFGLDPEKTAQSILEFIQDAAEEYKESQGENAETTEPTTEAPAAAA